MFLDFLKKKDWNAKLNSQQTILVKAGKNLLAAGLEAGFNWPHDCRVGSCGTCRCYLKKGKIKELNDFSYVLTAEELDKGMILACQTALKSDVEIEVALEEGKADIVHCSGFLKSIHKLTHDIVEMTIKYEGELPESSLAGQYLEVSYPGLTKPRNYSFAKAPGNEQQQEVTFYVRYVSGGEFTEWLFGDDRTNTPMTIVGPYGSFCLHDTDATMLCIAGGSGMSAVKAILEQACDNQVKRDAIYLFGARTKDDLYCLEEMKEIESKWNKDYKFKFVPVLSEEPEDSLWEGERGFVTTCMERHYLNNGAIDINRCESYMCGPPPMIDLAVDLLGKAGFAEDCIFYDKFLDASSMPNGR